MVAYGGVLIRVNGFVDVDYLTSYATRSGGGEVQVDGEDVRPLRLRSSSSSSAARTLPSPSYGIDLGLIFCELNQL